MRKVTMRAIVGKTMLALVGAAVALQAQATDISTVPIVSAQTSVIKPNLMFVLDDSGSMAWSHMPDTVDNYFYNALSSYPYNYQSADVGYTNYQCNPLYYNPNVQYAVPVDSQGNALPTPSFTAAPYNGFDSSSSTVNLANSFQAFDSTTTRYGVPNGTYAKDTPQAAYYYKFNATGTPTGSSGLGGSGQCFEQPGSTTSFTKVTVGPNSGPSGADERQNFAIWYSYYRTRIQMMKSGVGRAFSNINNNYRVGFTTISYSGVDESSNKFLEIRDFGDGSSGTQKYNWYKMFYAITPGGSTPLRGALSKVGRMYAGQLLTGSDDPVQYSCQQNFTLMSTDGYWNTGGESSSYGPFKIDGTTQVGNQDGAAPRPYYDGSNVKIPETQTVVTYAATSGGGCTGGAKKYTKTTKVYTGTQTNDLNGNSLSNPTWVLQSTSTSTTSCLSTAPANTTTTAQSGSTVTTGPANTLSDIAYYYYMTDLRPAGSTGALGTDVSTDNVPSNPSSGDTVNWQHMTTFTLGLGAPGNMVFSSSYMTDTGGDYYNVKQGTTSSSTVCNWAYDSSPYPAICNWPTPVISSNGGDQSDIDDLWHAAVDGRGSYFSASNASSLYTGLTAALAGVSARTGSAAAAATSSPNVTNTNNYVFSSTFTTVKWTGELFRQQIDLTTGSPSNTVDWVVSSCTPPTSGLQLGSNACANLLDNVPYANRKIYTYDPNNATASNTCDSSTTNQLKCFQYSDLTTAQQAYFGSSVVQLLSQYSQLTSSQQTAAAGANLVNYLRGDTTNYNTTGSTSPLYRARAHILGDIVSSEAAYVKTPDKLYADNGYATFATNNAARQAMVYVGGNDGMLHAFNADTGAEMWSYIPTAMLPNLYKLADYNYGSQHSFFVDGTPSVGDVCVNVTFNTSSGYYECNSAADWRTILVGGFNAGGSGYYALDVTDPANPKALWEFKDSHMGYTYGNPIITKMPDGHWVVLLTSGYNNALDGKGYLYVLNAATGTNFDSSKYPLATSNGTSASPSGLAKISGWADSPATNNMTLRVYGGDTMGSLWRFDLAGTTGVSVLDLADFVVGSTPQPITTKPELGLVSGYPVIYVGTGELLGSSDLTNRAQQSFYAIKDPLGSTGYGNIRANAGLYPNTINATTTDANGNQIRTITNNSHQVNFATDAGWYLDFPATASGNGSERVSVDPQLALGTLVFNTNIPNSDACTAGGYSWQYAIDYRNGAPVDTSGGTAGQFLGNALATRPNVIRLPDGSVVSITRLSDGTTVTKAVPIGSGGQPVKRVFWRELMSQ